MGGWVNSVVTLRLSQPSLAGVGAGAELGNIRYQNSEYCQAKVLVGYSSPSQTELAMILIMTTHPNPPGKEDMELEIRPQMVGG